MGWDLATQGTVVAAGIAFIGGLITADRVYRQKSDELFFTALNFLKGGSQNRNLGIAAIDLYWNRRRHRPLCVSLLSGSAIYLIRGSKSGKAPHEIYNLERIMALLLSCGSTKATRSSYQSLHTVILQEIGDRSGRGDTPTALAIDTDKLKTWNTMLAEILK